MSTVCANVRRHLGNEVGGLGRGWILRPFKGQEKGDELDPEVYRELWKVFELMRVVVKAELGRLTLKNTNYCVDSGQC